MSAVIGYITTKDKAEAEKIADALLQKRLIACANIVSEIKSAYWWKGKIEKESEALLLVKTRKGLAKKVTDAVRKLHSYSVPSIEFIPIVEGNKEYLNWIEKETKLAK